MRVRAPPDARRAHRAGGVGQDFVAQHSGGDISFAAFHMWPDKCAAVPLHAAAPRCVCRRGRRALRLHTLA